MDLPPSGWYPDPFGVPGLLRWWDGSTWTQHTHPVVPDAGTDGPGGGERAAAVQPTTVQPAVQPTMVQPGVQPTTVQPAVQPAAVQPGSVQLTRVQPTVQPTTVQPTTVQPTTVQPAGAQPPQGADAQGTAVLFLGDDAWTTPAGPAHGDRYGYRRARQRRLWMAGGLTGGIVIALALIALLVHNLGRTPTTPLAATTPAPTPAATTPAANPSPSPTPAATAAGTVISDSVSGLSYPLLPNQWQPGCPGGLNSAFPWSTGESAVAGQVNGGQTTWYGVACSGVLPQSYGYNGVADLENTATNLANQFSNTYYTALQHSTATEVSQPVSVSGHAGWEVKFLVTYTPGQGLQWTDELAAVVVADQGTGLEPAVFYVSVPGSLGEGNVDKLVSALQLTPEPQPGSAGSPGDSGSPGDGGSPAPAAGSPTAGP